ncbi:heavy metal-associated domain-containing protein [Enterococcus gallinarum]|uniref:heavy-metal-associated domain-containing protein n=1 Tax=Enterococcus gallinarum TaxID=1353 RepID=UPI00288EEE8A|nr:heavy metal-associated domain-containing protein [Enterococcus gallinarum]MDT2709113.1 heavy metal-associated domain-containing protein [Enterococcus gallinarum]MDT2718137.1 heavy metal-associated domain-containing protein [Enterococcus gallinarum]
MKKTYQVEGMKCEGCAKTVRETLARVAGVTEVTVNLNKKTATVISDAPEQALTAALKDTSYRLLSI